MDNADGAAVLFSALCSGVSGGERRTGAVPVHQMSQFGM